MNSNQTFPKILIVEDERLIAWSLANALHKLGIDIVVADTGEKAIEAISTTAIDLVITDVELPEVDGFGVAAEVKEKLPNVPVIMMTASQDSVKIQSLVGNSIDSFIEKPFNLNDISVQVSRLLFSRKETV